MNYEITHHSTRDGSPAMCVGTGYMTITLANEDGHMWTDPASQWVTVDEYFDTTGVTCHHCNSDTDEEGFCVNDNCVTNEYTSGEQYYSDYLNSDSNIAYLNGY